MVVKQIFSCLVLKCLPHRVPPRVIQSELKEKIVHSDKIDNVRVARAGSIIISTKNVESAIDVCSISEFLGISITKRFLLFNMLVEIPLAELGREIAAENNINIFELLRFICKDSTHFFRFSYISWYFSTS